MRERFHLLVLDLRTNLALTGRQVGRWLLPFVSLDDDGRPAPRLQETIQQLDLDGFLACIPCGIVSSSLEAVDRLVVWDTHSHADWHQPDHTSWTPLDDLRAETAFLPIQSALWTHFCRHRAARADAGGADGFDSLTWFPIVRAWIDDALRQHMGEEARVRRIVHHRSSPSRVVLEVETEVGQRVYFKGSAGPPFVEAGLTSWLSSHTPACCPPVIAEDEERGWMLLARAGGRPFGRDASFDDCAHLVTALAALQRSLVPARPTLLRLGLPELRWGSVIAQIDRLLLATLEHDPSAAAPRSHSAVPPTSTAMVDDGRMAVRRVMEAMERLSLPVTWVDTDLAPGNVFLTATGLQLVDLEKSMLACPHLALETLLANLARVSPASVAWQGELRARYERAWGRRVAGAAAGGSGSDEIASLTSLASRLVRMAQRTEQTDRSIAAGELIGPIGALQARAGYAALRRLQAWEGASVAR